MEKVKQGQTKWKAFVCDPGHVEGYDDQYVGLVYPCFVTSVKHNTVRYSCGDGFYMCHKQFWNDKLHTTFRKAIKFMHQQLKEKV